MAVNYNIRHNSILPIEKFAHSISHDDYNCAANEDHTMKDQLSRLVYSTETGRIKPQEEAPKYHKVMALFGFVARLRAVTARALPPSAVFYSKKANLKSWQNHLKPCAA
jgi:hypothetical protein